MTQIHLSNNDISRVQEADAIIRQSIKTHFTIAELAQKVGLPEKRLKKIFKQVYGLGLYAHLRTLRLQRARQLLMEGVAIRVIIREIGYKSESHFSIAFTKFFGQTPASFRKNNRA